MLKQILSLSAAFCCAFTLAFAEESAAPAAAPQTPEDTLLDAYMLCSTGNYGYAADQYMGDGGSWNGHLRDVLVAAENIHHAIETGDLKVIFEQSQYIPSSGVTAEKAAELTKGLPDLPREKKDEILKSCREQYEKAKVYFKTFATAKVTKTLPVDDNTAVVLFTVNDMAGKPANFTALLNNKTGKWMIYAIIPNQAKPAPAAQPAPAK